MSHIGLFAHRKADGNACRFTDATDRGHNPVGGLGAVVGGNAPAGNQQIFHGFGNQTPVGNGVVCALREEIVAGAAACGVMNVNIVIAGGTYDIEWE